MLVRAPQLKKTKSVEPKTVLWMKIAGKFTCPLVIEVKGLSGVDSDNGVTPAPQNSIWVDMYLKRCHGTALKRKGTNISSPLTIYIFIVIRLW